MTIFDFLGRLQNVTGGHGQYSAKCPAHDDRRASLRIAAGEDGRILVKCQAGCDVRDVVSSLGLTMEDLFPGDGIHREPRRAKAPFIATYHYGRGLEKLRRADKSFLWRQPDGAGGWIWKKPAGKLLYHLEEIRPGSTVLVVEGEKDVDTLFRLGLDAASGPDGAGPGKWTKHSDQTKLQGCHVCVIQDNDQVGRDYAVEVCNSLLGVAASVRLLDLSVVWPEIPEHGDFSDMVEALGDAEACDRLAKLMTATPEWTGDKLQADDPPAKKESEPPVDPLMVHAGRDLQAKEIAPQRFVVQDLIPVGLTLLASPPKFGKSWLVMDLCISVARGDPFLGYRTVRGDTLYVAMEDSEGRLQGRQAKILSGAESPPGFRYATAADGVLTIDDGLIPQLESVLSRFPSTSLIVIDTLQTIRGEVRGREGPYARDYAQAGRLKKFADAHGVALVLVHHLRKMVDDSDPFARISGTTGLFGAADTALVLTREKRASEITRLDAVGRDIDGGSFVLSFDRNTCRWTNLGDGDWYAERLARDNYEADPLAITIKDLVERNRDGWSGTAGELLAVARRKTGAYVAANAREVSGKLRALEPMLFKIDQIIYTRIGNGSGGGRHKFTQDGAFVELPHDTELPFEQMSM